MEKGILNSYDVPIIAYTDIAPSECTTGDIYYNTTNKLLYKATGTNTWSSEGSEPLEGILYILFDSETSTGNSYSWDGSDLISVGGGSGSSDIVIIGEETDVTEDTKLLVDISEDEAEVENIGSEVVDSLEGDETYKAPSVRAVNEVLNYSTDETVVGTWIDGKPIYRKVVTFDSSKIPNNSTRAIANVSSWNISTIITLRAMFNLVTYLTCRPIPFSAEQVNNVGIDITNGELRLRTFDDWGSDYNNNFVIVEYTKTTD